MVELQMLDSSTTDRLDRKIIHALQLHPRASFSLLARAIDTSEQTVARRYRRLRSLGVLRVIGLLDPRQLGETNWTVRLQCRPNSTLQVAEALAQRSDIGWVTMSAGGSEIVCLIRSTSRQQREDLLLARLPNSSQVLSLTVHATLHQFHGRDNDWLDPADMLDADQRQRLNPPPPGGWLHGGDLAGGQLTGGELTGGGLAGGELRTRTPQPRIEPSDRLLLDHLAADGRASTTALAKATGWTEGRINRRLGALQQSGALYFDVDIASEAVGLDINATLWLTVEPAHLAAAGETIAEHREVPYAAAVTGTVNLQVVVTCHTLQELYDYLTKRIGAIPGLRQVEVSPVLRRIKLTGALTDGSRLTDPPLPSRRRGVPVSQRGSS